VKGIIDQGKRQKKKKKKKCDSSLVINNHILGNEVDLNQYDIDVSASLLKVFVRELAEPLIDLKVCEEMGALPGRENFLEKYIYINMDTK
jgi:hypothetical protein